MTFLSTSQFPRQFQCPSCPNQVPHQAQSSSLPLHVRLCCHCSPAFQWEKWKQIVIILNYFIYNCMGASLLPCHLYFSFCYAYTITLLLHNLLSNFYQIYLSVGLHGCSSRLQVFSSSFTSLSYPSSCMFVANNREMFLK